MNFNKLKFKTLTFVSAASIMIVACSQPTPPVVEEQKPAAPTREELVAQGEYLVGIMGCNDCHSPKVFGPQGPSLDPEKLLSGHPAELVIGKYDPAVFSDWVLFNHHNTAAAGPWGVSFAANLTSDETGIGNWTLDQFRKALKEGKYKGLDGARMLLPPMPWPNYVNLTEADLEAIFAYLKSTKPVKNLVPAPIPPAGA
jgi:mono/diheme cytochrome c family protein